MTEPTPKTEELPREVRAGPSLANWLGAGWVGWSALLLIYFGRPRDDAGDPWWLWVPAVVGTLTGLAATLRALRAQVIADESGLRWRARDGWRSALWTEVRDFYETSFADCTLHSVVETEEEHVHLSCFWNGYEELRRAVAARATAAAAYPRGWAPREKRPRKDGLVR